MTKNNRPIIRGVLCFSSPGKSLRITGCEDVLKKHRSENPPTFKDDLKAVLEKLGDVKVALFGFDLELAKYKAGGHVSITEPPAILDDPEFFQEPDDSSSE